MLYQVSFAVSILYQVLPCLTKPPLVLLISFDGFRWDYIDKANEAGYNTPNFHSLISGGVVINKPGLTNSFITDTFPNHYTLVTGMYEENHGVVSNYMFDPSINDTFFITDNRNNESFWFNNGSKFNTSYNGPMPIWNINQMADEVKSLYTRRSGVLFWPGSEAKVGGLQPWYCEKYDESLPNKTRINITIDWFINKNEPINLGLLYFSEPDNLGHSVGPNDHTMMAMISELDDLVGFLINRLEEENLLDEINIIITSDHGMVQTDHLIDIGKHINSTYYRYFGESPIWNILPVPGKEDYVYNTLKKIPNVHVYWKEDILSKYHYTHNIRIMPIVIEAEEGYILCDDGECPTSGGDHGYNNSLSSMHPFFIAHGPAFKNNFIAKPFNNVDVFPLMCHILQVPIPSNIDGNFENIKHILQESVQGNQTTFVIVVVIGITGLISLLVILLMWHAFTRHRKQKALSFTMEYLDGSTDGHLPLLMISEE